MREHAYSDVLWSPSLNLSRYFSTIPTINTRTVITARAIRRLHRFSILAKHRLFSMV